jgi:histidinol-phosphatase (PHP family)
MRAHTTYHCHTNFSDGSNSVKEMIEAAIDKGFTEIGFSDHLVLHPTIPEISWSTKLSQVEPYMNEVRTLAQTYAKEIKVFAGCEMDFFPNNPREKELLAFIDNCQFDFIIGSIHMLGEFSLDDTAAPWLALSQNEVNEKFIAYYKTVQKMVQWYKFDFIGHFDIPKKFNMLPTIDLKPLISETLDVIKTSGCALELNTAGWDKDCNTAYPSLDILKECVEKGIPLLINDDAHCTENLGRHYEQAGSLLQEAHCHSLFKLDITSQT